MWARGLDERAGRRCGSSRRPAPTGAWPRSSFPDGDALHVHGAQPAVPDGQPVRVRRLRPRARSPCRTARASRSSAWPSITRATAARSTRSPATWRRSSARRGRSSASIAPFDGNTYTFIADYLPWANGDGMEHRNSTVLTSASSIRDAAAWTCSSTISHEFFHSWNVERIRPASLEPFNLEDANISGELWLAEGFTSYYEPLVTTRAGLTNVREFAQEMGRAVNTVLTSPGPPGADRRADEPARAVHRRGDGHRPHELRQHLHLLLHVGRGDWPGPGSVAARTVERPRHARRRSCGPCGRCTASPAAARPATWPSPTRWTT